jgi:hypothetical protein
MPALPVFPWADHIPEDYQYPVVPERAPRMQWKIILGSYREHSGHATHSELPIAFLEMEITGPHQNIG